MIEIVGVVLAAAGAGWLLRRRHRQRTAAGPPAGLPCMVRVPAGRGRWRPGRVHAGEGAVRWVPQRGEAVELSGGRVTGVRVPTVREGVAINPGSRIATCVQPDGAALEIAVMPLDVRELLEALPRSPR
ncbi:hypothetical protein [Streptomyces sp. cmx-4-9]|uniref:hypothetical protein n=1 Tax=Streptomyces sp. cmx-4-9 TaxID=2790941 RepID=UPI00397FE703